MHFLCLHGMGTNSKVLDSQLSALRHELGDIHTYDFVEGTVPAPLTEELNPYFPADDDYFHYFDPASTDSMLSALRDLDEFMREEGPYDGVIAFSQGACLIATYLVQVNMEKPAEKLPFSCAIFLCGGIPLHPLRLRSGIMQPLSGSEGPLLPADLATAHILASNDTIVHDASEKLLEICHPKHRYHFSHNLGHSIPGAKDKDSLYGAIKAMRRTIDEAAMLS